MSSMCAASHATSPVRATYSQIDSITSMFPVTRNITALTLPSMLARRTWYSRSPFGCTEHGSRHSPCGSSRIIRSCSSIIRRTTSCSSAPPTASRPLI